MLNQRNMQVRTNQFSMVPRGDVPRSTFVTEHKHLTTFDAGWLIPFHVDEVLPGDVHQGEVTLFTRLATPVFPIMDNIELETFFFFVPCRLVWDNWVRFMGERPDPTDSIDYLIPVCESTAGGWAIGSLGDYFGLPTSGQVALSNVVEVNTLPLRAYNLIWNEWFRDQNLQDQIPVNKDDGPDVAANYLKLKRNKRHDYFTSALPWPLKGGVNVPIPLSGLAPVDGIGTSNPNAVSAGSPVVQTVGGFDDPYYVGAVVQDTFFFQAQTDVNLGHRPAIYANLAEATSATINAMRLAVATQQLLERDARGGTRYTELLRNHFGVTPEDSRLQRPEYIGGGRCHIKTQAIPQTSATVEGQPLGGLGAAAVGTDTHRFSYSASEHGFIIGLVNVRADLTYQQGLHRMWTRQTRFDHYWPAFAHLGEQAIRNDEIFVDGGDDAADVWGYTERWAEYRHRPNRISGLFRSTATGSIDSWHLAQEFTGGRPGLNAGFIAENPPFARVIAAGELAENQQVLCDSLFKIKCTRPVPMYSVPGLDRF